MPSCPLHHRVSVSLQVHSPSTGPCLPRLAASSLSRSVTCEKFHTGALNHLTLKPKKAVVSRRCRQPRKEGAKSKPQRHPYKEEASVTRREG